MFNKSYYSHLETLFTFRSPLRIGIFSVFNYLNVKPLTLYLLILNNFFTVRIENLYICKNRKTMDLNDILSISGKSGLYRSIAQTKNGLIVESLVDKKRLPVYVSDKVSSLSDISIFTNEKDIPLKDVMDLIYKKESAGPCIDSKSDDKKLKKYFEEIIPDYNKEKVYVSDMRKMFGWYNFLHAQGLLKLEEKEKEKPVEEITDKTEISDKTEITEEI